ncbi:VOC family protein [Bradyrhizobium guangdongense]|uniref:VOC family protein n=1 Tax=Bradyrhizobium guangdongense TaxID=1325090 RepID=UPI001ABF2AE8|nr:hypothetical protein [Bradyrhizobium guangdongense]
MHDWNADHHHGAIGDPAQAIGNGILIWFEVDDFQEVVARARQLNAAVVREVHINPNAQHLELWIKDLDGYTVVVASPDGETGSGTT